MAAAEEAWRTNRAVSSDETAGTSSPVYNVPRGAVQEFVGRVEDLERLDAALNKGGPVAVSASLEGLAGVGKTELVRRHVN